jgi:prepilin-type N-terminal cleavage/methylation domain-containing protein
MKKRERGFTYLELIIALSIGALLAGAATMATFQVLNGTERNNDEVTIVRQVQNASYWINRDAQMSQSANTDNLTSPDFLTLTWTEWDEAGPATKVRC